MAAKQNLKDILNAQVLAVTSPKEDVEVLEQKSEDIIGSLKASLKKQKITADVFIGGSFAKKTIIKKRKYDIDIFVRFDKKYDEKKLSSLLEKIVPKNAIRLHGSRDYFVVKQDNIDFEIIPTLKISKPSEAKNVTDLSYFHVNYVSGSIKKNPKLASEIRLAKHFINSSGAYGAESYINGFSGYAVELLVIHYKSFMNFIKTVAKLNAEKEKIIIDPKKAYKNKQNILQQVNEAKLNSPIIFIDPTFKERNALAALSKQTFLNFQEICRKFIKNPSEKFFEIKDREQILKNKYGNKLIELVLSTEKQAGDIAGTKLKKFSGVFIDEAKRFFDVKESAFVYDDALNKGKILLVLSAKKEIIFPGPPITMKEALTRFKREHKKIKIIKGKAQASEKPIGFEQFMNKFENEKSKIIEEMGVSAIRKL